MKSYGSAEVRHAGPECKFVDDLHVFSPEVLVMQDLALRVLPAVTWLAVYRWLHIPVRNVWAQRRVHTNGSKNLFHRAILYRHKKILLCREDCRQDQGETMCDFWMVFL